MDFPGLGTLNHPLSEAHLAIIAARIDDWRAISPSLGLTAADDSAILGKVPNSVHAQRVSMLRKWKQILGKRATYEKLRQVFGQCRRTDLVEIVQQFVSSEESELTNVVRYQHHFLMVPMSIRQTIVSSHLILNSPSLLFTCYCHNFYLACPCQLYFLTTDSAKPIATIHQLSVTEQEQAATECEYNYSDIPIIIGYTV